MRGQYHQSYTTGPRQPCTRAGAPGRCPPAAWCAREGQDQGDLKRQRIPARTPECGTVEGVVEALGIKERQERLIGRGGQRLGQAGFEPVTLAPCLGDGEA